MTPRRTALDYASRRIVVLRPELDLHLAARLLVEHDISGAPVVDAHGALVGMLTEKDCFRAAYEASYHKEHCGPVADFMSRDVETIDADLDVVEVVERFYRSRYRRFPVVRGQTLVGLLSRRDVLRSLEDLW